jgi:predicted site-specific integrase-resolvase
MDGVVNSKEARELLRVTSQTLRRWDKEGKIETIRTPSGIRMYNKSSIQAILNKGKPLPERTRTAYCRVSSRGQSNDLQRQIEFYRVFYPDHEVVQDIGSGVNFNRPGMRSLLGRVMCGEIKEIVVAHRDRLCRFAWELIEWICEKNGTRIVVLDKDENQSGDQELAEDVLSIIHVFSCRQMGKRRYSSKENTVRSKSSTK